MMKSSLDLSIINIIIIGVVCGFEVHGKVVTFNWTSEGVEPYRNYTNPLRMELGDKLIFSCGDKISNLFIQMDQAQYESCNAKAGTGEYNYNGFCLPYGTLMLTLTENSRSLQNTVNFENNSIYYLSSYSNGTLRHQDDSMISSGGQCEEGVKMIIIIGEADIEEPTAEMSGSQTSVTSKKNNAIAVSIVVPVLVILVLVLVTISVIIIITALLIKRKRYKEANRVLTFAETIYSCSKISFHDGLDIEAAKEKVQPNVCEEDMKEGSEGTTPAAPRISHSITFDSIIFTAQSFGLEHQSVGSQSPYSESIQTLAAGCDNRIEHTREERDAKQQIVEPTCDNEQIYVNSSPPKHLLEDPTPIYENYAVIASSKSCDQIYNSERTRYYPRQKAPQKGKARPKKSKSAHRNGRNVHKR